MNGTIIIKKAKVIKFDNRGQKECDSLRTLGPWDEKKPAEVKGTPLHKLGQCQAWKFKMQKPKSMKDFAIEGVIGVITLPLIRLAVGEKFQRNGLKIFKREHVMGCLGGLGYRVTWVTWVT